MKYILIIAALCLAIIMACIIGACASDWASSVVDYSGLGDVPYDNPLNTLGKPSTLIDQLGTIFHCSLIYCAWEPDSTAGKSVITICGGGHLTVKFDEPIFDDPQNWYGKDFIIFGNSTFAGVGYVKADTDMAAYKLAAGGVGSWEPMLVSVAQYPDGPWYTYTSGPYADDFAPMQSFAWDWVRSNWAQEMDFTRPIDPSISRTDFSGKIAADAIDLYRGSAGGTAFDLAQLADLPVLNRPGDSNNGRKWIQYIRVSADLVDADDWPIEGEIDAFARVSHQIDPMPIGEAKKLPNGAHVILKPAVVTAGTYEVGTDCYIEQSDRSAGIKIIGRLLSRGDEVTIYGDMDTQNGERVVRATAVIDDSKGSIAPAGMPVRSIGAGSGLNSTGLLVRTCGRIKDIDTAAGTFTIGDGSGSILKCAAHAPVDISKLAQSKFISVTGISSCEVNDKQETVPVLLIRDQSEFDIVTE